MVLAPCTERADTMKERILKIVAANGPQPVTRGKLEFYLLREQVLHDEDVELSPSYDCRDSISELLKENLLAEGFARSLVMAKPPEFMTPLIFLDVDGVLNTHDFDYEAKSNVVHRDKIKLVNSIIGRTGASIVLSSAWRYLILRDEMDIKGLNWLFRSHGLKAGAIIDITGQDVKTEYHPDGSKTKEFTPGERAHQVMKWRETKQHSGNFVIIDDSDNGFTENGLPFVKTETSVGLTWFNAEQAVAILQGKQEC